MDTVSQVWEYCKPLFSKHEQCDDCQGDLARSDDEPAENALYTRNKTAHTIGVGRNSAMVNQ